MISSPSSAPLSENITVVLRIHRGSFADGFEVTLQILDNGQIIYDYDQSAQLTLPPAPELPDLFEQWRTIALAGNDVVRKMPLDKKRVLQQHQMTPEYIQQIQEQQRGITPVEAQVTHVNAADWRKLTHDLNACCKQWFNQPEFDYLSLKIQRPDEVHRDTSVPIIIRPQTGDPTQNYILSNLPWHEWKSLFTDLLNAEFALFGNFQKPAPPLTARVQILAIFGNADGNLNFSQDRQALALLEQRGADITQLVEPSETALKQTLAERAWDIFFFAGHSSSDGDHGSIQINDATNLPLESLRSLLLRAVNNGLKLAIFNSCDGLSIAQFLADEVKIPASIVMRQPIPDQIAGQFLINFLTQFSQGIPLYRSVRLTRERLPSHHDYPAADWLPTVCVNPNQKEFAWPFSQPRRDPQPLVEPWDGNKGHRKKAIILILLGIMGLGIAFLIGQCMNDRQAPDTPTIGVINSAPIDPAPLVSQGENIIEDTRIALTDPYRSLKSRGIVAFRNEDYDTAYQEFNSLRQQAKRDKDSINRAIAQPALAALQDYESLIYRNNALVLKRQQATPDLPVYVIGLAAPFNFEAGVSIAYGVAQAQDVFVNRQGLNLLVTLANDSNNEVQAQSVAAELAGDQDMLAVVGHYTSANSCAALNQYNSSGLVLVAPTSTTVNLASRPECSGNSNGVFFRTVSTTRVEASTLVNYLTDDLALAQPNVAVFYNSKELFSRNVAEQFQQVVKAFGGTVQSYDLSDPKVRDDRFPVKAQAADALVLLPDGGTNNKDAFNKALNLLKLNGGEKPVLAGNVFYLNDVLDAAETQDLVNRMFIAVDWHPEQCGAEAFSKEVRGYWGGDLNRRASLAYEAVQAIAQAITLSAEGADDPMAAVTRQNIRQKLAETGIRPETAAESATSTDMIISFDENGDRNEITTRQIVTVAEQNDQLRFELVDRGNCQPTPK